MIIRSFPYGSVLLKMEYSGDKKQLIISFRKRDGIQNRVYEGVPSAVAYKLYYENNPVNIMSYYSNNIRRKFEVSEVKLIK